MKKIITTFALICVLLTPVVPQVKAQELSQDREQVMRTQINLLQEIVNKLLILYVKRFGVYPDGSSADPVVVLENFLKPAYGSFSSREDVAGTKTGEKVIQTPAPAKTVSPLSILEQFVEPYGGVTALEDEDGVTDTENTEVDTTLESSLRSVLNYAGALYLDKGTYGTVCNKSEVVAVRREYDATCKDSDGSYIIYSELDEGYFCVDANGFADETDEVDEDNFECIKLSE